MTTRWWTAAVVAAANALTSAGFSIAAMVTAVGPAKIYAMYGAARALPLAAVTVCLVGLRSTRALFTIAILLGLIQLCDVLVGFTALDPGRTIGPLVIAVATLGTARWLVGG